MVYEFGPFRVEPAARRVLRGTLEVPLTAKAFDVLLALVERAGQVVGKEALLRLLWADSVVEENNLSQQVHTARRALGDSEQRFIRTVPRRGYQFVAEVRTAPRPATAPHRIQGASLAVMPFRALAKGDDEYLGLGLADALITRLSNVREIAVRPTSAVVRYASRDADRLEAARELGVGWLLDGSFRRGPERLRVTVQLLTLPDAVPVWGATFDDALRDPFSAQDEIARKVAEALVPSLSAEEQGRLSAVPTRDPDAFAAYVRGRCHVARRTESDLGLSIACFQQALGRDPGYALAHAALAEALTLRGSAGYGAASETDDLARARAAALRAVEQEPTLAQAHATLGFVRFRADWDWDGAERSLRQAIALNPALATGWHFLGLLLGARGRFEEALAAGRRAEELDPLSPSVGSAVGRILHFSRRYDEAIGHLLEVCARDPAFPGAHADLGLSLHQVGRLDEAVGRLERALDLSGGRPVIASVLGHVLGAGGRTAEALRQLEVVKSVAPGTHLPAYVLLGLGRHEEALDILERACAARAGLLVYLKVEPLFDSVRADRRFARLLEQARLAD